MDALVKRLSAGHDRVRYDEGAALLSMGIHSFMNLAEEAGAKERYKGIVLVRMNKVYQYLEYKMSRPNVQKILYKNVQLVCLS